MHIEAPALVDRGTGPRAAARVVWEGRHRGPDELWFETDEAFAADFEAAPEAFLLAAMPIACGLGEPRLRIDAPACARLGEGLVASMRVLSGWYPRCRVVPVEAAGGFVPLAPRTPRRAAAFVSGGIDSLSMLAANRAAFPLGDPASVADGLHLFGWHTDDFDGPTARPERVRGASEQRQRLERLGEHCGLTVVPVRTNARTFSPDFAYLRDVSYGAGMISAAHLFRRRIADAWFASSGLAADPPHGSHAALDGNHSSGAIEVHGGEPHVRRTDKMRAVGRWPEALEALQVCLRFEALAPGEVNCGRCEKCWRTMLALQSLGLLESASTFPRRAIRAEEAARARPRGTPWIAFSEDLADDLEARGQADLGRIVRGWIARQARKDRRRRWRARLASLGRRATLVLGGSARG